MLGQFTSHPCDETAWMGQPDIELGASRLIEVVGSGEGAEAGGGGFGGEVALGLA